MFSSDELAGHTAKQHVVLCYVVLYRCIFSFISLEFRFLCKRLKVFNKFSPCAVSLWPNVMLHRSFNCSVLPTDP